MRGGNGVRGKSRVREWELSEGRGWNERRE